MDTVLTTTKAVINSVATTTMCPHHAAKLAAEKLKNATAAMIDHASMGHDMAKMDHSTMDHSTMDHSAMGMDHSSMGMVVSIRSFRFLYMAILKLVNTLF